MNNTSKNNMNFTDYLFLLLKDLKWGYPTYPQTLYWEAVKAEIDKRAKQRKEKQKYYSAISRLTRCGFLSKENNKDGKKILNFTSKGLIRLQRTLWKKLKKNKLKKGEYCLVVFDIPETKAKTRDLFRKCLYELGFSKLQKSVFYSPYDVFEEVKKLTKSCKINECIKIMITRDIK